MIEKIEEMVKSRSPSDRDVRDIENLLTLRKMRDRGLRGRRRNGCQSIYLYTVFEAVEMSSRWVIFHSRADEM